MNPDIGAEGMSALQRASLARTGIWALPSSEVIYFVAERDEAGKPLDPSAVYQIDGYGDPQARWWSISVYRDFFWVENPLDRYSYSKTTVGRHVDGSYRILVASDEQQGNWLPTGGGSARLTLLFRLYQPSLSVLENPADVPLPTVRRVS